MNQYIKDWFYVIRNCSVNNTYKMAWAKAIVECCVEKPDEAVISFDRISEKMFKYYWNQSIFFDLEQSPNPNKPPEFVSYVKKKIIQYQEEYGFQPLLFDRIENEVSFEESKLSTILGKDVSHRFLEVNREHFELYSLRKKEKEIELKAPQTLNEYSTFLFESINYRWTQILENFNSSPRISQKVRVIDFSQNKEFRRKPLSQFHKYLNTLDDKTCFICGGALGQEKSVDHVIPWSYLYSDDLWNLVYVHKGCNSSKSNTIPQRSDIDRLKIRNSKLLKRFKELGVNDKHSTELELSIERDFPMKFWVGLQG